VANNDGMIPPSRFSTVVFYRHRRKPPKTVQSHAKSFARNALYSCGFRDFCQAVQSHAKRRFPITNQLLYQLSYAGVAAVFL
jgi:hypothetical protein